MRVAFIDQTGDEFGGAQLSLALLLQHLPPSIDAHAILFHDGVFAESIRTLGIGTDIVRLSKSSSSSTRERPNVKAALELPGTARAIGAVLRARKIELVHTNSVKAHVFGGFAARLQGLCSVAHLRDIITGFGRYGVRTSVAACTQQRIAISGAVAKCFDLPRTTVIRNPLDLSLYRNRLDRSEARSRLAIPPDAPLATIVGRINRWKGQDRFLRALATVNKTSRVYGAVVGSPRFRDADFLPELHALSETLGLSKLVTFIDWVDDPRVVYSATDIHVNASTQEPFGRTTIEAAAMSVPTVCFDDSGVAEFMLDGTTGLVVPAHDETALANGIRRYADDETLRRAAGAAAKLWSQQFDATEHARLVSDLLLDVRARAGRRREGLPAR